MFINSYIDSRVYRFLSRCGKQRTPVSLMENVVKEAERLVPFDQARILCLDENGRIVSSLLYGVEKKNWKRFMDYYEDNEYVSRYTLKSPVHLSENQLVNMIDWHKDQWRSREFVESYVKSLHLTYSLGMGFTDDSGCLRHIITLDRTREDSFEKEDLEMLSCLHPLINDYHADLYVGSHSDFETSVMSEQDYDFTKREKMIVELMINGISPRNISERLCISIHTTYKHISNIYKKTGVTNRNDLIRMLR